MSMMLLLSGDAPNPRALFAAGEQGFWYDPSDFSTLFQDSAGTTPVTAVGQGVGLMLDKSGRGNHASQTSAPSRPLLQQDGSGRYYLSFDGTDDWMVTNSINFSGTDKMTAWTGVRKLSDAARAIIFELGNNQLQAFKLEGPNTGGQPEYQFTSAGSAVGLALYRNAAVAAPNTSVLTVIGNISVDSAVLRVNGVQVASGSTDQGTGNYGNYPLYIGRRGGSSLPFNGRIYGIIIRGAASNAGQIAAAEAWMNSKTGAY